MPMPPPAHQSEKLKGRVLLLTAGGPNPFLVANALSTRFDDIQVLLEEPERKAEIFRRRARRFGPLVAAGQMATMIAARLIRRRAAARVAEIVAQTGHDTALSPEIPVHAVGDINSPTCLDLIERLSPDVVLLVSTRLLTRAALSRITCPVINLHAGINPLYRGQFGGYWSLAEGDVDNFGATLHLVDAGTDTGATLYEARVRPHRSDNISTYPLLLTATALPATLNAVEDALCGRLSPIAPAGPSRLRFPPAIWGWIFTGLTRGIW